MNLTPKPILSTEPDSLLLYGAPKVGKSTLMALLARRSRVYALAFDATAYKAVGGVAWDYCPDVETLEKTLKAAPAAFAAAPELVPDFIVVDPVDRLEDLAAEKAVADFRVRFPKGFKDKENNVQLPPISSPGELMALPWGMGYGYLRDAFMSYLIDIAKLQRRVIFLAHVRPKAMEKAVQETNTKDLALTGRCCNILCGAVDTIAFMWRDKHSKLSITTRTISGGGQDVNCGSRYAHLANRDIILSEPRPGAVPGKMTTEDLVDHWDEIFPSLTAKPSIGTETTK